jgi:sec-independent protein translocase protein TatC
MSDHSTELKQDGEESGEESEYAKMSFLDHLDELRKRLIRIIAYLFIGFFACWAFSRPIYDFLAAPLLLELPENALLVYTSPTDVFLLYMKVSFLASIFLTLPFTLYEVWKFIAPGLYKNEKKYVIPFILSSIFLFVSGAAFCYYVVLPAMFRFLIQLGESFEPMIRINEYLSLTNRMLLGFGLIFEMPVLAAFLSMFGIITASFLWKKFKYSLVGIVALAAVISPTGDAFNLLLWSAPMVLLYFLSIAVAALFGRFRRRKGLV